MLKLTPPGRARPASFTGGPYGRRQTSGTIPVFGS